MTIRTRLQRRYASQGYTWEITTMKPTSPNVPKLIVIHKSGPYGWRSYRPYLLKFMGEYIRPIGTTYIHKGRKPTARRKR